MSATERAVVEAELAGQGQVVSAAKAMKQAIGEVFAAGRENGTALGNTLSNVTKTIGGIASAGAHASGVLRTLNVGAGVEADKAREKSIAALAQTSIRSREELKAGFATIEKSSGVSQAALVGVSQALADVTGDTDFAINSISGLTDVAAALGQDVGDQIPLFAAIHNGLGVTKDARGQVDKLVEASKRLGTIGGPKNFLAGIAALGPELEGVRIETDKDRERFIAFYGAIAKGAKTPQQAAQRVSEVLGSLKSNAAAIQFSSGGKKQVDEKGRLVDPLASFEFIQSYTKRKFGSNTAARERANLASFGPAVAGAIENTDTPEALRRVQSAYAAGGPSAIKAAARQQQNSDVGNRDKKDRAAEGIDRNVGNVFNRLGDYLNRAAGPRVAAGYSTLIGTFGSDIAAGAGGRGDGVKGSPAGGYVGKLVSSAVAVTIGTQLAGLGEELEQQDALRGQLKKSDREFADQQAAEQPTARELEQAGNNEALAIALRSLPKDIAAAMAQELRNTPLKVKPVIDPNAPKGN